MNGQRCGNLTLAAWEDTEGGLIMKGRWFQKIATCQHTSTISVIGGGLERAVCEECGHVSVRYESSITGNARRENFARPQHDVTVSELVDLADMGPGRHLSSSGTPDDGLFLPE